MSAHTAVWKSSLPPFLSEPPPTFSFPPYESQPTHTHTHTTNLQTKVRSVTPAAPPPCSLTFSGGLAEHKQWSSPKAPTPPANLYHGLLFHWANEKVYCK